jgi:hypothetical protein
MEDEMARIVQFTNNAAELDLHYDWLLQVEGTELVFNHVCVGEQYKVSALYGEEKYKSIPDAVLAHVGTWTFESNGETYSITLVNPQYARPDVYEVTRLKANSRSLEPTDDLDELRVGLQRLSRENEELRAWCRTLEQQIKTLTRARGL